MAIEQMLDLQLPTSQSTNRLDVTVGVPLVNDTDTQTAVTTGNALATIDYDLFLGQPLVNSIEFTGGQLNLNAEGGGPIEFRLGSFISGLNIDGTGLGGTLDTPSPPGAVASGTFDTEDHVILLNQGTLDVTGRGLLGFVNERVDLAVEPVNFTTSATATIDVMETAAVGQQRAYEVTLILPVDATYSFTDPVDVDVSAVGTIEARGTFSIELPVEGDYTGDGLIDLGDYNVWRDTLGATGPGLAADGNFDWVVDQQDYAVWQSRFANASSTGTGTAAVPEPTSLYLWALGGILGMWRLRADGRK